MHMHTHSTQTFNQTKDQSSKPSDKHTIKQIKRTTKKKQEKTRNKKPYLRELQSPARLSRSIVREKE
jgi:hypothetical protein